MGFGTLYCGRRFRILVALGLLVTLSLPLGLWLILHAGVANPLPPTVAGPQETSSLAYQGVPAEFEHCSAIVLGCNELVAYHPRVFTDIVAALRGKIDILGLVNDDAQRE